MNRGVHVDLNLNLQLKGEMGRTAVAVIISLWVVPISILVNRIVPDPYMDEIFHIPQAQQYCKGNFRSWDPMITTPPGLYYLSLAHVASIFSVGAPSAFSDICSPAILRSMNGVMAALCGVLFYEIIIHLRPELDKGKATLRAVVLALYPLHWFFSFLYYTDVASVMVVLAMYLTCLKQRYQFSALFGAFAVLIRQTNIVWILFVACTGIMNSTLVDKRENAADGVDMKKNILLAPKQNSTVGSNLRKRKSSSPMNSTSPSNIDMRTSSTVITPGLLNEIQAVLFRSWHLKWQLLVSFSPFIIVLVTFSAFVLLNGSVVLGAKEAHAVSPHFTQIMYFGLVSALFMAPLHFDFSQAKSIFHLLWTHRPNSYLLAFLALTSGLLCVQFFSIAHPYLLADNRHYPFYLWRKVIMAHWSMKYVLVPLYMYSWLSIFKVLGKAERKIWLLIYFVATAAVLVPAPLIEFRYYTIPFYLLMLHSPILSDKTWLLMGMLYMLINAFTVMMFLFRPFQWDHEPGVQRFIW